MSVINQVLKELDRQGANASVPNGVIALDQPVASAPRWPWWLLGVAMLAAAAWWFHATPDFRPVAPAPRAAIPAASPPLAKPVENAPQLQLSRQLSPLPEPVHAGRNPRQREAESVSAVGRKSAAPAATSPAPLADNAAGSAALRPRLDARLPETRQAEAAKAPVIKEIKQPTPQTRADDAWRQAGRWLEQGRNHDARELLETALRLDPAHAGARQSLIALVLETGDSARAEALLREGLALQANDPWYPRSLAQLHLQRGDSAQAAAILKTGLAKRADAANWGLYAGTLAKLGKPGDAALAYREALRLNPAQGNWWIGLAVTLEQTDDQTGAGEAYQRALQTRLSAELRDYAQQKIKELER